MDYIAADDPTAVREAIRRVLSNERINMYPQPDGSYRARSVLFPLTWRWKTRKPRKCETSEASSEGVGIDGCAGAICGLKQLIRKEIWFEMRRAA